MGKNKTRQRPTVNKKVKKPPILFYSILALVVICLIGLAVYAKTAQDKANEPKPVAIDTTSQPFLGKKSAPVTIVEFGDYKCPYCKHFDESFVPKIKKDFVDKGKAKFYFINFPFIFTDSKRAAGFAETVYKELGNDAFWKFHEKLYHAQPEGQENEKKDIYTEGFLTNLLKQVANDGQVTKVLDSFHKEEYQAAIDKDLNLVGKTGIQATPAVFVNGKLYNFTTTSTYDDFKKFVEDQE